MSAVLLEISLIFVLLIANGLFAMTEIAIVSARRGQLQAAAAAGSRGAAMALTLAETPNRFLSTVQIGITLVGILAGAFGGATISSRLEAVVAPWPVIGEYADKIAFVVVIGALTYFSLIIGELVPKRLAMLRPEGISSAMARPLAWLSSAAGPLVSFLGWSTDGFLRVFGVHPQKNGGVTKDEVTVLIREGTVAGSIQAAESKMVEGVFQLNELEVLEIMTPRPRIAWLSRQSKHADVWHKIVASNHTYFPIYEESRDRIVGVVSVKALYAQLAAGAEIRFDEVMTQPLFVPEGQSAIRLLESFKSTGVHVAFVVNEFGSVVGMVTILDLLEAIVGDLPSREQRRQAEIRQRTDGSWLLDATIEIEKVTEQLPGFSLPNGSGDDFQTLAGFVLDTLGRLPQEGDILSHSNWKLEIIDMDGHRVDKVLATAMPVAPKTGGKD